MLFSSFLFILVFLPLTLVVFYIIRQHASWRLCICWLVIASLFYYGWWNPVYLFLIAGSIACNFIIGYWLSDIPSESIKSNRRAVLIFGITANLAALGYFKYAGFLGQNLNSLFGSSFDFEDIILPLAISFFTFQQIAYLVDAYQGKVREHDFLRYCLFVTFFPQLIAGPIVHHHEMMPQFEKRSTFFLQYSGFAIGISIFVIGLFKKVVLADGIAVYATPVFDSASQGIAPDFFAAWGGNISLYISNIF